MADRLARRGRRWCLGAGLGTVLVALSPVFEHRAERSLTAHMTQHVLLLVVAAPLLALGAPVPQLLRALPERARTRAMAMWRALVRSQHRAWGAWAAAVVLLQAAAMFAWHVPAAFEAADSNVGLHALEHVSYLATATLFWWVLVGGRRARFGAGVVVLFIGALPCTALGAALTLADHPWYQDYVRSSAASALTDQQLAGVVMWGFAGTIYVVAAAGLFAAWLSGLEARMPGRGLVATR